MPLAKEAQSMEDLNFVQDINFAVDIEEGQDVPIGQFPEETQDVDPVADIEVSDANDSDDDINDARFLVFNLDNVPGALNQEDIEPEIEVEEEPEQLEVEEERDPWDWHSLGLGKFLPWLHGMMHGVPTHSGYDTAGLERAIAYFEHLDKEISKAMRMDFKNEIDVAKAEEAREQIEKGLERLVDRLEKVKTTKYKRHSKKTKTKKKSEADAEMVKNAQKITGVEGRIQVTVPLLISGLARVCINGMVSAGHDIEDMFHKLADQYKLDDRQRFELVTLLGDMGYPVRRDRGAKLDSDFKYYSSDNNDWNANYPG